ncbi:MAG: glycosyltransferase family 39 protein [Verrucomicrobiota bacterium]
MMRTFGVFSKLEVLFLFLAGMVLFNGLGNGIIAYNDELLAAERSREFLATGDWWVVHLNFEPVFNKPPLQYWLTALALKVIPDEEFAVRFWSVIYAILTLMLTMLLARRLFPEKDKRYVGIIAAVFLLLYGPFLEYARIGVLDAGMAFWSVLLYYVADFTRRHAHWWLIVGLVAGIGAWQKTPITFLFWLLILVSRLFYKEERKRLICWQLPVALILGLIIYAIWPVVQSVRFGDLYYKTYIQHESKMLISRKVNFGLATYVIWISIKWCAFALLAYWGIIRHFLSKEYRAKANQSELLVVLLGFFVIVSCLTGHTHRYIFPILPLFSLWGAYVILQFIQKFYKRKALLLVGALVVLVPCVVLSGIHYHKVRDDLLEYRDFRIRS